MGLRRLIPILSQLHRLVVDFSLSIEFYIFRGKKLCEEKVRLEYHVDENIRVVKKHRCLDYEVSISSDENGTDHPEIKLFEFDTSIQ